MGQHWRQGARKKTWQCAKLRVRKHNETPVLPCTLHPISDAFRAILASIARPYYLGTSV